MTTSRARWIAWPVAVLLGASVVTLGLISGGFDPAVEAPEYKAISLDGDSLSLADLRGRVVLLNVWATWCVPCVREMPALERLHQRYRDRGLEVVAVSLDAARPGGADPIERVREYVRQLDVTFEIWHDPSGRVEQAFQIVGVPYTIIIDRSGRIRARFPAERPWDEPQYSSQIEKFLED